MRGRKPKPTEAKKLAGNPGKRKLNEDEPKPPPASMDPPIHLEGDALEKWYELAAELHPVGLLTSIDVDSLMFYCTLFARWKKAEKIVKEKGEVIKTVNGNIIQNPYLAISNRALKEMNRLAVEFGLTPASRSRIRTDPPDSETEKERRIFGS